MGDDIHSGSTCFCFSLNLRSAAQFVVYGHLTTLDDSLSLNPNLCHHPLITQLNLNLIFCITFQNLIIEVGLLIKRLLEIAAMNVFKILNPLVKFPTHVQFDPDSFYWKGELRSLLTKG